MLESRNLFGPWWCAYTFADTTLSGSADWRAYFTPLSEDGKYYTHMAEPTTQYVVASKDCKIRKLRLRSLTTWLQMSRNG